MARMKKRRYAGGGELEAADEIVVQGKRPQTDARFEDFNLRDYGGSGGFSGVDMADIMGGGSGGGRLAASQRFTSTPDSQGGKFSLGKTYTAAGPVYGPKYSDEDFSIGAGLGRGVLGNPEAPMFGATGSLRFKKGGKVKKMAKGGSTASKRADGCATKGKTKGRFV